MTFAPSDLANHVETDSTDIDGFQVTYADPNFSYGSTVTGSSTYAYAKGYYIMLAPLGLDSLVITYGGSSPAIGFTTEVSANINIPEPTTWTMLLLGFAGIGYASFHKARRSISIVM